MATFHEFPRTPHLPGSAVVDDDRSLTEAEFRGLCLQHDVVMQEKVDGTNVSVHFEEEWQPVIQKRSGLIETGNHPQYNMFRTWVYERIELLWGVLHTDYCLFGEWLWAQHGVAYAALPDYFLAFDLLEKESGLFLAHNQVAEALGTHIQIVPLALSGKGAMHRSRRTCFSALASDKTWRRASTCVSRAVGMSGPVPSGAAGPSLRAERTSASGLSVIG